MKGRKSVILRASPAAGTHFARPGKLKKTGYLPLMVTVPELSDGPAQRAPLPGRYEKPSRLCVLFPLQLVAQRVQNLWHNLRCQPQMDLVECVGVGGFGQPQKNRPGRSRLLFEHGHKTRHRLH